MDQSGQVRFVGHFFLPAGPRQLASLQEGPAAISLIKQAAGTATVTQVKIGKIPAGCLALSVLELLPAFYLTTIGRKG